MSGPKTPAADINLSRETLLGVGANVGYAAIRFGVAIYVAREFGPALFGAVMLLFTILTLADRPLTGIAHAGEKRISEDDELRSDVTVVHLLATAAWFILLSGVVLASKGFLASVTGLPDAGVYLIILAGSYSTVGTLRSLVQGRGLVGAAFWADTLRMGLVAVGQVLLIELGHGAAGWVGGMAAGSLIGLPMTVYLLDVKPTWPRWGVVRSVARFARFSSLNSVINTTYRRLDLILIGLLVSATAAGYFEAAWKLTVLTVFVADSASAALMPRVSGTISRGGDAGADIQRTLGFASILSIPVVFGAVTIGGPLIQTFYGAEYLPAALLLIPISINHLLRCQVTVIEEALKGLDRPRRTLHITTLSLITNVGVGIPLLLAYGPVGIVVGSVIAEAVKYAAGFLSLRETFPDLNPFPTPLHSQIGAGMVMAAVVATVRLGTDVTGWAPLLLTLAFGGAVFCLTLLLLDHDLRVTVRTALGRGQV